MKSLQEELKNNILDEDNSSNSKSDNLINNTKFLIPLYLNHLDKFALENIIEILKENPNLHKGLFVFVEEYKNLTLEKFLYYRGIMKNEIKQKFDYVDMIVSSSTGHPSKYI